MTVRINGKTYAGHDLRIENGRALIDGRPIELTEEDRPGGILVVHVVGDAINVRSDGDVHCGDVRGAVEAAGDVQCDSIHGGVRCSGDVYANAIQGASIVAGGDVVGSNRTPAPPTRPAPQLVENGADPTLGTWERLVAWWRNAG